MTKFYFHILCGREIVPDDEGMELSGLLAARAEALSSARDIALAGGSRERRMIQITNASGTVLDSVPVFIH